jgi:hypothetical protein
MNQESQDRLNALLALSEAARRDLWTLDVPGWAYWLEGSWCPECDGHNPNEWIETDLHPSEWLTYETVNRDYSLHINRYGMGKVSLYKRKTDTSSRLVEKSVEITDSDADDLTRYDVAINWANEALQKDGVILNICHTCGGTGDGPSEWTTDGLMVPYGMVAVWMSKAATINVDKKVWCPYSPINILDLALSKIGSESSYDITVSKEPYSSKNPITVEITVFKNKNRDADYGADNWYADGNNVILVALEMLGKVYTELGIL